MTSLFGKQLNGSKVAKGFILRQARRKVGEFFSAYNREEKGPARLALLITKGVSLESLASPDQLAQMRQKGKQFSWAARLVTDEEFNQMLPKWYWDTIQLHGDAGARWHERELTWLKGFFGTGGRDGG